LIEEKDGENASEQTLAKMSKIKLINRNLAKQGKENSNDKIVTEYSDDSLDSEEEESEMKNNQEFVFILFPLCNILNIDKSRILLR